MQVKPKLYLDEKNRATFNILNRARKVALLNKLDWKNILHDCLSGNYLGMLEVLKRHYTIEIEKEKPLEV